MVRGSATAKLPNHNAVSIAKAEVAGKLNDYVEKWRLPSESSGQTLVRLIARGDDEVSKLYDRYLRAGGDLPS